MARQRKVTRQDMELEPPTSIRDVIIDGLHAINYDDYLQGKPVKPLKDEKLIEELLSQVYARIETEALKVYKSNEPWALKAWAFSHILEDTVASEATQRMAEELMSPVIEWQDKLFDPLAHFRKRVERLSKRTQEIYLQTATRFVIQEGKKSYYPDADLEDYQIKASKRYKNNHSYYQEMERILLFIRSLPHADKSRELPLGMPKPPKKSTMYRPISSFEDLETLIWATVIDNAHFDMVTRLIGATVYGRRRSELAKFEVHIDRKNGDNWVLFPTEKHGEESPHPIPQSLVPLFDVPITPWHAHTVDRRFKKFCKAAGITLPQKAGIHWVRRRVATTVRKVCASDIDAYRFMRWSEPRELAMLAWYDQTPYSETDTSILEKHPFVKIWEEVLPYLLQFNPSYQGMLNNT